MPPCTPRKYLDEALEKYGSKLLAACRPERPKRIDGNYTFISDNFRFSLTEGKSEKFFLHYDGNNAILHYPTGTDFSKPATQEWLRRVRITALKHIASQHLPQRLKELAAKHGYKYSRVSLRDIHSRWGSCSSRGNISLSIYLQLLPTLLSDYVLLHELCHTVEMSHSERFWRLLDKSTGGEARQSREALKKFRTDF